MNSGGLIPTERNHNSLYQSREIAKRHKKHQKKLLQMGGKKAPCSQENSPDEKQKGRVSPEEFTILKSTIFATVKKSGEE